MNRNRYRLIFNRSLAKWVPVAETARRRGRAASKPAVLVAGLLLAHAVQAELPVPCAAGSCSAPSGTVIPGFVTAGEAAYHSSGANAVVNQVGDKSILNWQSFNVSPGHSVRFQQVDSLATQNLVPGASFTSLNRIWDLNPSVIAGMLTQAAGQKANVILVNSNGIAFMGGSQVNLNSFTASTLNMADGFLANFLPGTDAPQFENALGGGEAHGFIKVLEGAQISAGNFGRVMLIAPTVVNKGKVTAPDGQVIAAAGTRVYLRSASSEDANVRGLLVEVDSPAGLADFDTANASVRDGVLDGQAVRLSNAAEDKLGHATNLGELAAPRGNVSMVGLAVNQMGIARATTSVVSNGSVYLLAKDTKTGAINTTLYGSARGGSVLLGQGSLTEVLPEPADATSTLDGTTGQGLAKASQVRVQGQDIRMAGGAAIIAPAGEVKFEAIDNPSSLAASSPFKTQNAAASHSARIHIDGGARISVAGLEGVPVSAARNTVEVELRGDELKDSPANQQGALRGEKVYVDIERALANANAGKSTLIAKDSLESYQAKIERTVAERSTTGGSVELLSQGETILESGTVIDLSGGSLRYTPAQVKTTLLTSSGRLFDLAEADAETRYDGIATRYVRDYGRWNVKEVFDLGPRVRYDPGYVEGKNAGSLDVIGMKAVVMQADIQGRTRIGELQRHAGQFPKGARLTFGSAAVTNSVRNDYKLNQRIEVSSTGATLPAGFKFGDALPQGLRETMIVNPALLGQDRIATLGIFSNQAAEVREALRAPQGGGVRMVAKGVTVLADIEAGSGSIDLAARNNLVSALIDPKLSVGDGVALSARGAWINEFPGSGGAGNLLPLIDGGSVSLVAEASGVAGVYEARGTVALGKNTLVNVTGGGRVRADGKLVAGKGGDAALSAYALEGVDRNLIGYALGKGGSLKLASHRVQLGGNPNPAAGTLNLDGRFFGRGGFADFSLTALDRLTVSEGTVITPTVVSLDVKPEYVLNPSGSRVEGFTELVTRHDRLRQAANIQLAAKQSGVGTGEILIGAGARIQTDPKARIALEARNKIDIEGGLVARGGTISATLDRSSDAVFDLPNRNPIWLGDKARLDVSGVPLTYVDNRGLVNGEVLPGGTVKLNAVTGYVVSEAGSRIDVSGVAPVRLDVPNESGGLGRMVGSDAGTLSVFAEEGMLLDGNLAARAGGASDRGGVFSATLGKNARIQGQAAFDAQSRVLSLAQTQAPQTAGLSPDDLIPNSSPVRARLAASALEQAGFDRISLSSRDAIQLEAGLNVGAARAAPLREVKLDAARITTTGGDASIRADAVGMGNYDGYRLGGDAAYSSSGVLKADARLLELVGNLRLRGMQRAELTGSEAVRLTGTFPATAPARPGARIESAADLLIRSAVVAPSTYSQANILAPGKTVSFARTTDAPLQPFSAQGSLTVEARDIVQDGNLWAPFGQIKLNAANAVTFKEGSLTSVAAAPGSLVPFGKLQNGREWVVDVAPKQVPAGQLKQDALTEKSVRIEASRIDMQPGAKVDLSGGGDLQGYELTVGPGGSRDILADANTYAILPAYRGGFAPADPQEGFNRASGEAVYLSGVPGLADGLYTLLPAHYALLPGAYAVKLDGGFKNVLPGQAYTRQDGVRIAAGYVTDTRAGAPRDANWQGMAVMTRDQVRARSELTLTRASEFFADSRNRPQDAGLLSINTTGSGSDALKLEANYNMAARASGRGGQVDISALKLAVISGTPAGLDPGAVILDTRKLNALGADSLLLGATRSADDKGTTLAVGADTLTVANDVANALKAPEIMLAAKDTLTLQSGSVIDAQGVPGDAGHYETSGNGAFVRAASTSATFSRSGNPDRSQGTLRGAPDSVIRAANSVILDATKENAFDGAIDFSKDGAAVAGSLAVGAKRINFGAAPAGSEGLNYNQGELDALRLAGLTLTSYSTFDLYGGVTVGALDGNGKPMLQNLMLQGAGLAGIHNAGQTAQLNAQQLTLSNPGSAAFVPGGPLGSGALSVTADTITLAQGDKKIAGFGGVTIVANELVAADIGKLDVTAPVSLTVARISGERNSDQRLASAGILAVAQRAADRVLTPVTALGAKWALQGTSVDFGSLAELPSGGFKLTASSGDVTLGVNAHVDVAGREVQFFDVKKPSWGGSAEFVSETGNIEFKAGSKVNVSAAAGGDAGTLIVRATNGAFTAAQGSMQGQAQEASGERGEGARAEVDVKTLAGFSALNTALNSGGFDAARALRVRNGDITIAAGDTVKANAIRIAADAGKLDVAGKLNASGGEAGRIELHARDDVNIVAGARLDAVSTGVNEDGGDIEIGTREGRIDLASGSAIDVSGGAQGGTLLLRAPRNGSDVNVNGVNSTVTGARSVAVEAVRVYDNVTSLVASGGSGSTLSLATVNTDNNNFAASQAAIKTRLGKTADPLFKILSGVEIRAAGDLTLASDWNLSNSRAGGEPGVLTLRAAGNLKLNSNLSDGFSHATPFSSGTTPANLLSDDSWSYRLIGGADSAAADPLATRKDGGEVVLASSKLVRTGTGDIRIAAGRDIKLMDNKAVIYTAGRAAPALSGFINPLSNAYAKFSEHGGDVVLSAQGNIEGVPSAQLINNWLFRQGRLNADGSVYTVQPAWWVRFDQFQQGVGALGGGDVSFTAGGTIKNLSASAPTQARMASMVPDAAALKKTGGGSVRVEAGGDILGGQYYADRGKMMLKAGGMVGSGQTVFSKPVYTILALGDAQAEVQARDAVNIHTVLNPHWIAQSSGSTNTLFNVSPSTSNRKALFSTYAADSGVSLASLGDSVALHNGSGAAADLKSAYAALLDTAEGRETLALLSYLPPTLETAAYQGDIVIGGDLTLVPAATGKLSLLARDSVRLNSSLTMSDRDPALLPSAVKPVQLASEATTPPLHQLHAATPVHTGDRVPVRVYAVNGDITGISAASGSGGKRLDVPKAIEARAGRDVRDFSVDAQHTDDQARSVIHAGRDLTFASGATRTDNDRIRIGGPGRLELTAGRDIDLGTSAGIISRGDLDNPNLPVGGADIHLAAGTGANGVDYQAAVDRLIARLEAGNPDDATLWHARWLTGDEALDAGNALAAVRRVDAMDADGQREQVRNMLFTALRATGRDSLSAGGAYAADYKRGYAALELVFPGIGERNPNGNFKHYQGSLNMFASRVKTERGGDIEFLLPGGGLIVGLSNTPANLVTVGNDVLGMVAVSDGEIRGFARDDILVNQSRILTVGGGDVLLWSSEGDIDAGKGKKTATAVPPPVIKMDSKGNVTQELQGAASGSGIGALATGGRIAGDVDLIAPKGAVNAGDAGIRARNLNIAAQVVLGADNISVSGTSTGTPVADTSAVTATTSGAAAAGDEVSKAASALAQGLSDAAREAEEIKKRLKPTFISAEVIGHGE